MGSDDKLGRSQLHAWRVLQLRLDVDYLGIWNEKASDSNFAGLPAEPQYFLLAISKMNLQCEEYFF